MVNFFFFVFLGFCAAVELKFTIAPNSEECIWETFPGGNTASNEFRMRYYIDEIEDHEVDCNIYSPSGIIIKSMSDTAEGNYNGHASENGAYKFCFHNKGSYQHTLAFSTDFASFGKGLLTVPVDSDCGVIRQSPSSINGDMDTLDIYRGSHIGLVRFDLSKVSPSVLNNPTTRVRMRIKVMWAEGIVDSGAIVITDDWDENSLTWNTVPNSVRSDPSRGELVAEWKSVSGKDVIIDLTDPIKSAILEGKQRVTIVLYNLMSLWVKYYSKDSEIARNWPELSFEVDEDSTTKTLSQLSRSVFTLKSEITYLKYRERTRRDTVESTCSRVQYLKIILSVAMVALAYFQNRYVQSLINSPDKNLSRGV